jgi:hypothetical protein
MVLVELLQLLELLILAVGAVRLHILLRQMAVAVVQAQ